MEKCQKCNEEIATVNKCCWRCFKNAETKTNELVLADVTLEKVKYARFGCQNCLWYSCECEKGSSFKPDMYEGQPTCKNYAYCD